MTALSPQEAMDGITIGWRSGHPTGTCESCQAALAAVGYALVPVKEALTVERCQAALGVVMDGIDLGYLTTKPDAAAALLAALETSEVRHE